jgi:putative peptidoglycan lipid II flippase
MDILSSSINRRIFEAAVAIAAVTALVKLAALSKEMLIAWRFGTGDNLDAFNVAQTIPFFLISIAGTSFQTAFIPTYVQVQQREGTQAAQQLFSSSIVCILVIFFLLILCMLFAGPVYLPYLAHGFAPEKQKVTFHLLGFIAPTVLLVGMSNLCGAVLNVKNVFALVAAVPLITTIITVLLLLLAEELGIYALAIAVTLGAAIELLLIGLALRWKGIPLEFRWYGKTNYLQQIARLSLTLMVSNLLASGSALVNVAIAASLTAGSVAALGYANKLLAMPIGLVATALGTALMPYFSRMIAAKDWAQTRHTLRRFLHLSLGVSVPVTVLILLFAEPLTSLVFQRGAFAQADVTVVSILLFYLAWQFPFYVASTMVSRLLESLQANRILLIVTFADFVFNAISAWFLSRRMQVAGIAAAITLTRVFSFLTLYFFTWRVIKKA